MSAISLTINALLDEASVTAIVSNRIQPHPVKQGTALPAIAVTMSAENMEYLLGGASQYPQSSVQIHCLATAASAAIELGEAVKLALQDLSYTSLDTPPVHASFSKEAVDFMDFSDDLTTYRRVMSFDIRWRAGSTDSIHEELPGVVADQVIEFGGKTMAGAGGAKALDEDGAEVGIVSVDSVVSGTGTGWTVSTGGTLVRTTGTPAASDGAILTCTTALGAINVTIKASGNDANGHDLARSWSVVDHTELAAAAKHATLLEFGDNILLRTGPGIYNSTQTAVIGRSTAEGPIAGGPWVPPSLYDAAHPDKGYDLDTGNFVKITPHAGANPVIAKLRFIGNQGGGAAQYYRFHNLTFSYIPLPGVTVTGATYSLAAIAFDNGAHTVAVDDCDISSQTDPVIAGQMQIYSGIQVGSGIAWIQDNHIHDVGSGIMLTTGVDSYVIGNTIRRWWADGVLTAPGTNHTIAWNRWYDGRNFDSAGPGGGLHPDCLQFQNGSVSCSNVRVIGNRFQLGDFAPADNLHGNQGPFGGPNPVPISVGSISGTVLTVTAKSGPAITNGMMVYGVNVLPGTTIVFPQLSGTAGGAGTYTVSQSHSATGTQAMMATHTIRDSLFAGNLVVLGNFANLLYLNSWGDSQIYNNTVVNDPMSTVGGTLGGVNLDGIVTKYNVTTAIGDTNQAGVIARTPTVYDDNFDIEESDFAAFFVDPQSGAAITDLAAQYAIKSGFAADTASPVKAGAHQDYVDFANRETSFPWAA